ncbi:Mrp/NBP35 family ATP-binding protein [Acetobacter estunensis]|uniref:Mrp/NBP35 family ATP-binding protein n=1 Tax=Acetobacter estunensis TaxID=104097 RepID=UPI001C2D3B32|nr:Mrp/NBP35 family ATP-binding protein [Acetobacter estunensis]MBV1838667.1 Mrp/NBP35 family ATP-binding protein [Acetobacter estunensis]
MTQRHIPSREDIGRVLGGVIGAQAGEDVAVESCRVEGERLLVTLSVPQALAARMGDIAPRLESVLASAFPGWQPRVVLTAHRTMAAAPPSRASGGGHRPLGGVGHPEAADAPLLPGVKAVIAVASGKGGVGKSTTAVNLAAGLALEGLSVGLMDADVHGPSLPRMLGIKAKPEVRDGKLIPLEAYGLKAMSIGMMVDEEQAMIWRGPMVMGAIGQLLGDVEWGALDVLVIDMPPGTGDAQLTLAKKGVLGGAIIVSTPQDIALLDARRGIAMFGKTNVPVLGIVENMSYFCCPNCHHRTELFGHGGARDEARKLDVPFLGEIPLLADIRMSADAGRPLVIAAPDSEGAQAYRGLARTVAGTLRRLPGR